VHNFLENMTLYRADQTLRLKVLSVISTFISGVNCRLIWGNMLSGQVYMHHTIIRLFFTIASRAT